MIDTMRVQTRLRRLRLVLMAVWIVTRLPLLSNRRKESVANRVIGLIRPEVRIGRRWRPLDIPLPRVQAAE